MKKFLGFVGILVVLVEMKGMVEAADLYVPGDYSTIQAAINAADPNIPKNHNLSTFKV